MTTDAMLGEDAPTLARKRIEGAPTENPPERRIDAALEDVRENVRGARELAEKWWRWNRVDRIQQSKIVEMERASGGTANISKVNLYINAFERTLPERQSPMDKAVAAEIYAAEIDRIRAKQHELDEFNKPKNDESGESEEKLSPHSRFQSWSVMETMTINLLDKYLRARGVELGDEKAKLSLEGVDPNLRKQIYEAMEKSKNKITMKETTREVTIGGKNERTDSPTASRIIEADQARG